MRTSNTWAPGRVGNASFVAVALVRSGQPIYVEALVSAWSARESIGATAVCIGGGLASSWRPQVESLLAKLAVRFGQRADTQMRDSQSADMPACCSAKRSPSSASGNVESFATTVRDGRCTKMFWPFMPTAAWTPRSASQTHQLSW